MTESWIEEFTPVRSERSSAGVPNSSQVTIKCVVIGDSGVGKTRLICSKACGTRYSLQSLVQTHVPTVWAIDHYWNDKAIVDQSWQVVDGLSVSLRLWDTFGYHDKDREFAYGRADVILLCFSLVNPRSLDSVLTHWWPEISRLCENNVPVVLCGCQADLRYLYKDPDFLDMAKSPFYKRVTYNDIVTPEYGRGIAKQLGIPYYECSVLDHWGIDDVFDNVIRLLLQFKRERRFSSIVNRKYNKVQPPRAQKPKPIAMPKQPTIEEQPLALNEDFSELLSTKLHSDIEFVFGNGKRLHAHRACMSIGEVQFFTYFSKVGLSSNQQTSSAHCQPSIGFKATTKCIGNKPKQHSVGDHARQLHPVFVNQELVSRDSCTDLAGIFGPAYVSVITISDDISADTFNLLLQWLYTGKSTILQSSSGTVSCDGKTKLQNLLHLSEKLGVDILSTVITNILTDVAFRNLELERRFVQERSENMQKLLLNTVEMSDVTFEVIGGIIYAHKAILTMRSDVMYSMFSHNFTESIADKVVLPGVQYTVVQLVLSYLYTGRCPIVELSDGLHVVELSHRYCLPNLVLLVEKQMIERFLRMDKEGHDIIPKLLMFLEPCQLYSAENLVAFCCWYLCCNYVTTCKKHIKILRSLQPENQTYLSQNCWPPMWYVTEQDHYEWCKSNEEREQMHPRSRLQQLFCCHSSSEDDSPGGRHNTRASNGHEKSAITLMDVHYHK